MTGQFRRTLFQRIMLTAGQFVLAIACGVGLGFLATAPEKNPTRVVIQATGILVVPVAYRAAVFAVYKDLPIFWLGQSPPTVLEVSFAISIVFFIATSLVVHESDQILADVRSFICEALEDTPLGRPRGRAPRAPRAGLDQVLP